MKKSIYHSHLARMLGTSILESRKKLNIRQKALAEMLGFSPQFMGQIETGKAIIPEDSLTKAIHLLQISSSSIVKIYKVAGELGAKDIIKNSKKYSRNKKVS